MKKYVNGQYIEMTEEEISDFKKTQSEIRRLESQNPPTSEERLEALENAFLEMLGVSL